MRCEILKWIGSILMLAGTLLLALEMGGGFPLRVAGDVCWITAGVHQRDAALIFVLGAFLVIDVVGVF